MNPKPTATVILLTPKHDVCGPSEVVYGHCTSIRYHLAAGSPVLEFTDAEGRRHVTTVPWQLTWEDKAGA